MPNKIKCLVVDDEAAAHYVLINYINCVDRLELAGHCYNVLEAINFMHGNRVDLVFMDINMPELTGFDFIKALSAPPAIILTTAYSEYALQSYEYNVVDYLLKPVEFARFLKAIDRFLASRPARQTAPLEDVATEDAVLRPPSLSVKVDGEMEEIKLEDILYSQSLGNYVKLVTLQRTYICSITTTELEKRLPAARFMRIHKSHVVSLQRVEKFLNTTLLIAGKELPVGITYRRNLAEKLK